MRRGREKNYDRNHAPLHVAVHRPRPLVKCSSNVTTPHLQSRTPHLVCAQDRFTWYNVFRRAGPGGRGEVGFGGRSARKEDARPDLMRKGSIVILRASRTGDERVPDGDQRVGGYQSEFYYPSRSI